MFYNLYEYYVVRDRGEVHACPQHHVFRVDWATTRLVTQFVSVKNTIFLYTE